MENNTENKIKILKTAIENETNRLDKTEETLRKIKVEISNCLNKFRTDMEILTSKRENLEKSLSGGADFIERCQRQIDSLMG